MEKTQITWQPNKLMLFFCLITVLVVSWVTEQTGSLWLHLDTIAFNFCNQFLAAGRTIQVLFAYMNQPWFDWFSIVLLASPCFIPGLVFPREHYKENLYCLLFAIFIAYMIKFVWVWVIAFERVSPSLILDIDYVLPNLVPDIRHVKFMSKNSFPADHGAIILTWMIMLLRYAKPYWRYIAVIIAVTLSLPRLVSGAHWLSDILVGGLSVALLSLALVWYTPLCPIQSPSR